MRRLRDRPASAVIFFHGSEEFQRERAVQEVIDLFLDPATRDFNLDQIQGTETSPESLGSLLATPPMMADHRVVIVRDVQGLSVRSREVVESALANPCPGVILLLIAAIPSRSKAKFYDVLKKGALTVEFGAVHVEDLPGWLIEHAEDEHGVEIDVDAARAWAAAIGPELGVLATEVEKAVAFIGERKTITVEDVRAIGGYIPRVDRWAWLDTVGNRQFIDALNDLPKLLDGGETGVGLVIAIGTHFLRLAILVTGGPGALEKSLNRGQARWLIRKLQPQVRKWTAPELDRALSELLRTDRLLKTNAGLTDRQALEELLLRLAALAGTADSLRESRGSRRVAV